MFLSRGWRIVVSPMIPQDPRPASPVPALAWLLLVRNGGGFPSRWCEGQWEPGLISQDLRRHNSREAHAFTVIVHQKRTRRI